MSGDTTNIPVTIYLSPTLKRQLDKACESHGYSITGFARIAIQDRLAQLARPYDSEHLSRAVSRS